MFPLVVDSPTILASWWYGPEGHFHSVEVPQVHFLDKLDVPVVFRDRSAQFRRKDRRDAVLGHGFMPVVFHDVSVGPDSASHCLEVPLLQLRAGRRHPCLCADMVVDAPLHTQRRVSAVILDS